MCIRDSGQGVRDRIQVGADGQTQVAKVVAGVDDDGQAVGCLLYTSDAADERSSVDLGGRRVITKKKTKKQKSGNCSTCKRADTHEI